MLCSLALWRDILRSIARGVGGWSMYFSQSSPPLFYLPLNLKRNSAGQGPPPTIHLTNIVFTHKYSSPGLRPVELTSEQTRTPFFFEGGESWISVQCQGKSVSPLTGMSDWRKHTCCFGPFSSVAYLGDELFYYSSRRSCGSIRWLQPFRGPRWEAPKLRSSEAFLPVALAQSQTPVDLSVS